MPLADLHPDELLHFANTLQGSSVRVADVTSATTAAFADLHTVWNDRRYDQFAHSFEESVSILRAFCAEADLYVDFLREKARLANEYLYG